MPSPFPGMDPFIESQRWRDFHTTFITILREQLTPRVKPRYIVDVEEYVYLAREDEPPDRIVGPDLSIRETELVGAGTPGRTQRASGHYVIYTLPVPERVRQAYLTIRTRDYHEIVTVIELLSSTNKTAGEGRTEYLFKRTNISPEPAGLIELDLLRGGIRLPTVEPLQPADYYAFVRRKQSFRHADGYGWTLREPMPVIPVPLAGDDPDVSWTSKRPSR